MIVATPGARAGLGVRTYFESILEYQPVDVFRSLGIGGDGDKIADGEVTHPATLAEVIAHVRDFAAFCAHDRT